LYLPFGKCKCFLALQLGCSRAFAFEVVKEPATASLVKIFREMEEGIFAGRATGRKLCRGASRLAEEEAAYPLSLHFRPSDFALL